MSQYVLPRDDAGRLSVHVHQQRVRRPELTTTGREAVQRIGRRLAAKSPLVATLDERQLRSLLRLLERVERGASAGRPVGSGPEGE